MKQRIKIYPQAKIKRQPKAAFGLESGLVHSRFPDTPDTLPVDFRSANTDPVPVDIRCPLAPITVSADVDPPYTPDPEHSDFKDQGAATSKNSNEIVHFLKLTDSFSSQGSRGCTRRRKSPDRLIYRHY